MTEEIAFQMRVPMEFWRRQKMFQNKVIVFESLGIIVNEKRAWHRKIVMHSAIYLLSKYR